MNDIVHVAVAVIVNDADQVCISLRHEHAHQGGLWEFPGGKVEHDESIDQALVREIKEELDLDVLAIRPLISVRHDYPDKSVHLHVRMITQFQGQAIGVEGQQIRWIPVSSLADYDFPAANKPIVKAVSLPDRYLITGEFEGVDDFTNKLRAALDSGVRLVQLRLKQDTLANSFSDADKVFRQLIEKASALCVSYHARLMLNLPPRYIHALERDDLEDAGVEFDGIHFDSRTLMALDDVAIYRDKGWLLSASCHDSEEVMKAEQLDLDFVVLSPVCETTSHPGAPVLGWERFEAITSYAAIPVYALGGLSGDDIEWSWRHGAQGVAAISGFWTG